MQVETGALCQLRPEIVDVAIEDALALILNCWVVSAERYRVLERKHQALREFIDKGK